MKRDTSNYNLKKGNTVVYKGITSQDLDDRAAQHKKNGKRFDTIEKVGRKKLRLMLRNMKLLEYKKASDHYSGNASELIRQHLFAGIAVIWIFCSIDKGVTLPRFLLIPLFIFVLALVVDLTHYLLGYRIWDTFYRSKEKEGFSDNDTLLAPVKLPGYINKFFGLK